jgi:hypothetical protein
MHTEAGPLHASREMLELLRLCRARGATVVPKGLDVGGVHATETELGATLPDDVLVLLATRDPDLACATGLSLDTILDAKEDWGDGLPEGYVAIAHVYSEPFAARETGAHGGAFEVLGIATAGDRTSTCVLVDGVETTLAAFARDKITAWFRDRPGWLDALQRERALPLVDESFQPELVGSLRVAPTRPERWVTHPKFGRGRVIEERADGGEPKVVVDFEGLGRKTLAARFVTDPV